MELKIVDPETPYLHEAFGITMERRREIMGKLDEIMMTYWKRGPFKVSDILVQIAAVCTTWEEFALAAWTNGEWMEKNQYLTKLY